MGILFPNEAIARRWDGALQARLCRAPLLEFLRSRAIVPAPAGVAEDTDNLVRATVLMVEAGITEYCSQGQEVLGAPQRIAVGHVACIVSRALAHRISQLQAWRNVALVSTARLLSPWVGLNAAALASASCVREFQKAVPAEESALDARIAQNASCAINAGSAAAMADVAGAIAMSLVLKRAATAVSCTSLTAEQQAGS
jgi:hypothetical protein